MIALLSLVLAVTAAPAREITDATGRVVTVPDDPERVFAAGPPAAVLLYMLKPEAMVGWVRAPRAADRPFLLPSTHSLPELGRLTGRGDTVNLEVLLAAKPDLIFDLGTVNDTYLSLAERVQGQTGVPYVLIDGSFADMPQTLRQMAEVLGVPERGERLAAYAEETLDLVDATLAGIPQADRPGVYLARGPEGLETAGPNSINAESIGRVGARNVVEASNDGLATVSPENVLGWAPDVIIMMDPHFAETVAGNPAWAEVPAVANNRIYLAPSAPFGFIDGPPSVNRLIGLHWLMHRLYPETAGGELNRQVQDFYELFYQVRPDDDAVSALVGE
ncbi:iron ABC transporter substrate-binding protein [Tropicimonas sp.]|uniref:iron ABC transporter substrate-binding protein n=1 Tax=Tropicimonas sp. TaxID=2067044 RepID=UPI003A8A60CA